MTVLDGTEKALYQNGETAYQAICEEFHRTLERNAAVVQSGKTSVSSF